MFTNIKSVYFIGIGGISMSALAILLKDRGLIVKGSDLQLNETTNKLVSLGIDVAQGNSPEFVKFCDGIVFTGAISEDNPDLSLAKSLKKKIFSRSQVLGYLSKEKKTISVAGTHGKTTTTGMISTILLEAGLDPTIHIGGVLKSINSNLHIGQSDIFVSEACEYKDAFLDLSNYISVVLNIEEDHLDYFKSFDNIISSFNKFIENTNENGCVVYNYDDCEEKLDKNLLLKRKSISFGFCEGALLRAINIDEYQKGRFCFDVLLKDEKLAKIKLSCIGMHNIYNALASMAVCLSLGVNIETIAKGLENFKGIGRRMDIIKNDNPLVIHDYAHHPKEIEASLKAIKSLSKERLVCIFQPHTFTRTQALYKEFLLCFNLCDEVWLLPIYPAREKPIKGITSKKLSEDLIKNGQKSRYFSNFFDCKNEIIKEKDQNSTFAILGAGDIEQLAMMLNNYYN